MGQLQLCEINEMIYVNLKGLENGLCSHACERESRGVAALQRLKVGCIRVCVASCMGILTSVCVCVLSIIDKTQWGEAEIQESLCQPVAR